MKIAFVTKPKFGTQRPLGGARSKVSSFATAAGRNTHLNNSRKPAPHTESAAQSAQPDVTRDSPWLGLIPDVF